MMDDAVLGAVAAAVAARAVEGITDAGRAALTALIQLVRRQADTDPSTRAALVAAQAEPTDDIRLDALRTRLAEAVDGSPAFADELAKLWQLIAPASQAIGGGVVNHSGGTVHGHVVQARDVRGGIVFGSNAARRPEAGQ